MSRIEYIRVGNIFPHKDNPRKEIGDVSELADSIKESGILQNLTVIPLTDTDGKVKEDYYTVIIGHRRLAAAKLAGLEEVPCVVIPDMDYKTQIATMHSENMQRSDLTIAEQAQGFQMMLDLGMSYDDISKKTGVSRSTVRERVKLAAYDMKKLNNAFERGGTLQDYAELEKVKSLETREKLLDYVGTNNFRYELRKAIEDEMLTENKIIWTEWLNSFATEIDYQDYIDNRDKYVHVTYINFTQTHPDDYEDKDTTQYFYAFDKYSSRIVRLKTDEELKETENINSKLEEQEIKEEAKRKRLEELQEISEKLRLEYARSYIPSKGDINILCAALAEREELSGIWSIRNDSEYLEEVFEFKEADKEEKLNRIDAEPEKYLLAKILKSSVGYENRCYDYSYHYVKKNAVICIYDMLESLCYEASDEELAYIHGTHEVFSEES